MTRDKVLFFFTRKDGLSRQEFHDHYLHHHAPLGLRVTQTMAGYTVNLVDNLDRLKIDPQRIIAVHAPADGRVVTRAELLKAVGRSAPPTQ